MAAFVAAIVYLIITAMRYSSQNKDIDAALVVLNTGDVNAQHKQVIASCLGRKLEFKVMRGKIDFRIAL